MTPYVVGVRFRPVGKVYHYDASCCPDLAPGEFVVVPSRRGTQIGEVMMSFAEPPPLPEDAEKWRPVLRRATGQDLTLRQLIRREELRALLVASEKVRQLGYTDIKLIEAELSFDRQFLTFLYGVAGAGKPDTRTLYNHLVRKFPRRKIEFRRVGPRDVAKLMPGMGACGRPVRCCAEFLTEFSPVSIKMAKVQGISLTPSEITGSCGRLRCCLVFEYEQYAEAAKGLPKRKKRVLTPEGEGKVIDVYPLKQSVLVALSNGTTKEFRSEDLQPANHKKPSPASP